MKALHQIERKEERIRFCSNLRQSVAHLEEPFSDWALNPAGGFHARLGIDEIDHALDPAGGRGILVNALHEIRVETGLDAAAGAAFAMALGLAMAKAVAKKSPPLPHSASSERTVLSPVFWISDHFTRTEYGRFYGPGLALFGLRPPDLIRLHPRHRGECLWAAGEIAATSNTAAFCLIEITGHPKEIGLTATRRLMLRAQASGTPVLLLRQSGREEASAAATRWRVSPALSGHGTKTSEERMGAGTTASRPLRNRFIGPPAFAATLEKCRGGHANPSTHWTIEWNRDEQRLASIMPASMLPDASRPATAGPGAAETRSAETSAGYAPLSFNPSAESGDRQDQATKTG